MGFGLIFTGYITLLFFKIMPPAMAVGAYLMYAGLKKLNIYGKSFVYASNMAAGLGIYYLVYCVIWLVRFAGIAEGVFTSSVFVALDDIVYYTMLLLFHVFLYKALEEISREVGYTKGIKRAYMSRVLLAMFYAFSIINVPLACFKVASYIPLACVLCQLSMIIYTAMYIYGCYMSIATDEVLAEEQKKIAEYDAKYGYRKGKKTKNTGKRVK